MTSCPGTEGDQSQDKELCDLIGALISIYHSQCRASDRGASQGDNRFDPDALADIFDNLAISPQESLGQRFWHLISNWDWVTRRVESVRLNGTGDTRRHISFDLSLRKEDAVAWSELRDNKPCDRLSDSFEVVVPLTFLNKGTIVNLDIQNNDGNSLPNLTFSQNGRVTYQALCYELKQQKVDTAAVDYLRHWAGQQKKSQCDLGLAGAEKDARLEHFVVKRLLRLAVYDLIHTSYDGTYDSPGNDTDGSKATIDVERQSCLDKYLECILENRGLSEKESDGGDIFTYSTTKSASICFLCKVLGTMLEQRRTEEGQMNLARLIAMLGTVCGAYVFTVLRSGRMSEGMILNRDIIKFSCDTEVTELKDTGCERVFKGFQQYFCGVTEMLVRCSTWSSHSTHLEVRSPETTFVTKNIKVMFPKKEQRWKYTYRTSGERTQMAMRGCDPQPVTTFRMQLSPTASWNGIIAAAWATMTTITFFILGEYVEGFKLTGDQHIGYQTMTIGVMTALLLTISRHPLARECWWPIRIMIPGSLVVSVLPPLVLMCTQLKLSARRLQGIANFLEKNDKFLYMVLICCAVFLLLWALIQYVCIKLREPKHNVDNPILVEYQEDIRLKRNVMAITETGVFDTAYLNRIADRNSNLYKSNDLKTGVGRGKN